MRKSRLNFASYSYTKRRQRRRNVSIAVGVSLLLVVLGVIVVTKPGEKLLTQWMLRLPFQTHEVVPVKVELRQLLSQPPAERREALEAISKGDIAFGGGAQGEKSLKRSRARYLLASDLIELGEGKEALKWLEGLENQYPVLAGYITMKRAQAYEVAEEPEKAFREWKYLLENYTNDPIAAEALYALTSKESPYREGAIAELPEHPTFFDRVEQLYTFSADDPKYWRTALEKYPSHPRILALAKERLEENGNQPELMLLLAHYAFNQPETIPILDRLVSNYRPAIGQEEYATIQPKDWEAIAKGYWQDRKYSQASAAYENAPRSSKNAYLIALGLEYSEQYNQAQRAYKQLISDFPNTKETPLALLQLAQLLPDLEAVPYYDRIVKEYPEKAGVALLAKAETLQRLGSSEGATKTLKRLVSQYGHTEAAADYRWKVAYQKAQAGDISAALEWIAPIRQNSLDSEVARQAIFWEGKWAKKLGRTQQAQQAFETVLTNYPWSYYAWRSAVHLGKDVGDFDSIRQISPPLELPPPRPQLPSGSVVLQELYQIARSQEAWTLWQAEFSNRLDPTMEEQFTDGLLHQEMGQYLRGIELLWELEDRNSEEEQAKYREIEKQRAYWQGIYPFPFSEEITTYSQDQELNPLLTVSVMRQESRFDPDIRSTADAVGLMQIIPSTAEWAAENVGLEEYSLEDPQDNIQLGTWFLAELHQSYNDDSLLAIASYNAGQGNVGQWLQTRGSMDDDEFVESIPFDETRNYVKQVFGNYWNYLQLYDPRVAALLTPNSTSAEEE